ncbi:MAG: type II toxin-antitoxin system RelE/ParE family toxin [Chitinophagales bacterium]
MEIFYKTKKLEKTLTNDAKMKKTYGTLARHIRKRMKHLKASPNLATVKKIPQLKLHKLGGKRQDEWSINISENWVITFEVANNPIPILPNGSHDFEKITIIEIVFVGDYH